ncbi:MAG TPA: hypothetical protein VKE69_13595 [Planctomycetota bacterium]|nr:hypothetical protein [Planctomycetota bacterium]
MALAALVLVSVASTQAGAKPGPRPAQKPDAPLPIPVEKDAALVAKINEAVARGEAWLVKEQGPKGSWNNEERGARTGYTELALYALASSAEAIPSEPDLVAPANAGKVKVEASEREVHALAMGRAIVNGLKFVHGEPHPQTYALSLLLLTLDARAAPRWERSAFAKMSAAERQRYAFPRAMSREDRSLAETTVTTLLQNRFRGLWSYEQNPGTGDISNTQFGLLGLRAAARCGVFADPKVWWASIDEFLRGQEETGPSVKFSLPRSAPNGQIEAVEITAQQRCWGYWFDRLGTITDAPRADRAGGNHKLRPVKGFSFGASGTHAAIGIASLQIARDEMRRALAKKPDDKLRATFAEREPAIDRAIRDGIGWLAGHWTLEEDPGGGFPFYYLYSIERAGQLVGDRILAGHDWYREGAEILLARQLKDGAWPSDVGIVNAVGAPDAVSTAFALLFLRRATAPTVITPNIR